MAEHEHNMMYMPIIDIQKEKGQSLFNEYMETGTVPLAYEVCWKRQPLRWRIVSGRYWLLVQSFG